MWYNIKVVERWPVGQAVKTLASHAGNMGSIPVRVTKKDKFHLKLVFFYFLTPRCEARGLLSVKNIHT